jgi:hypothetical protein
MDPEIRGACRFYVLLDMKNKDIFDKLQEAYGEGYVLYVWIRKWAKAFREGRTSLADDPRSGRLSIPDGVERIRVKVECDPYQSVSTMARYLGLSRTYALEILKKSLNRTNTHYVAFHTLSKTIKELPELKWQPQC